jgi:hypothetical protein
MSEPTPLPQYQIDHIISSIRTAMVDVGPRHLEAVCSAIRQELNSPTNMSRFEGLLDRYYKSNTDLTNKLELFHQTILQNQTQVASLLKQMVEGAGNVECPNNPDLELIKSWLEDLLFGEEYKLRQQVRDLLESGVARGLRNMVITYITITALVAVATGIVGYFALSSTISKAVSTEVQKLKPKGAANDRSIEVEP